MGPTGPLSGGTQVKNLEFSELKREINSGNVLEAKWQQTRMTGKLATDQPFEARVPDPQTPGAQELERLLDAKQVKYDLESPPISNSIVGILSVIAFPLMIIALIYFLVLRPAQMGGNQALNFGRSKAKRVGENTPKITFDDVAGID